MYLTLESIHLPIYRPDSGPILTKDPLYLRTELCHRRAHKPIGPAGLRLAQAMLSIHKREFPPNDRRPAHWEGNWLVVASNLSAIGTQVERHACDGALVHSHNKLL